MLAVVAPTIYGRSASALRRVTRPLGVGAQCRESVGLDLPPLLALWNSVKARSSFGPNSAPQWGRLLSSASGESGDGSDKSDKAFKEGEGLLPSENEIAPEDGSKGTGENGPGEGNKGGKKFFDRLNPFKRSVSDKEPEESTAEKEPVEVHAAERDSADNSSTDDEPVVSAAIVPNSPRPENFPKVVAIPLTRRPLFPGFYVPFSTKDTKLAAKLMELRMRGTPWVGTFLVKDGSRKNKDPVPFPGGDGDKDDEELHGEELYKSLHEYGTFAQITNVFRAVDGGEGVSQFLLMGHRRLRLTGVVEDDPLSVTVEHVKDKPYDGSQDVIKATVMEVVTTMKDLIRLNPLYKEHIQLFIQHMGEFNASKLADFGAALTTADEPSLQEVLEELDVTKRLYMTLTLLKKELELSKLQASIARGVEEKISGEQRRFFLMEQLKAIKKELGLETDDKTALTVKFRERLESRRQGCPAHVLQVIDDELNKLQGLESSSSEFNVTRNYLDWLTSLPWGQYSEENFDVGRAQEILDAEHYGLADVKERILEFIAVGKLRGSAQGKIICLAGPPGVGKTSIGRSIAHALNRQFYRFSVGGLGDVAEIKGHRRTYVGAMPGKMVQCLKATGTANPLVLIDEIDKLGRGHTGDPASALLELLDPEQNANFLDHYLDVPIDLSKVLFVCTANVVESIPGPLLDRMEVIRLVGYITDEKMHIARDYLERAAREGSGVKPEQVEVTDGALHTLIETYCREAGVRNLQKHIEKIYRKIALKLVRSDLLKNGKINNSNVLAESASGTESNGERIIEELLDSGEVATLKSTDSATTLSEDGESETSKVTKKNEESTPIEALYVDDSNLADYVGNPVFQSDRLYDQTPLGVVMGLAWTAMGGSTLYVETRVIEQNAGKGSLQMTGQLGDVMKESATIAHTVARAILREKQPDNSFFSDSRLHLHVPAGATPKDGPSAGCTMITSMLSLAIDKPVRRDVAMTGEVTLTGRVLPIGGVKEKTVAARRSGVKVVIFPSANQRDFDELPAHVKEGIEVHFVDNYSEIFDIAFCERQSQAGDNSPQAAEVVQSVDVSPMSVKHFYSF
ncbi:ATP-dependent Lon protease [Marchantia polymorpha subsp. ruderalis]|uniref:Lon protease homolog, mitochondrial n=1 Tax=Marchantia polymorpha subsp. ruderalis TaxID=1480154 RepID=A0A176WK88_MARPO|nr:hypothetical protein AXG93_1200s1460 [Marchantia polymorpha subsp. ruderalis]